ncbi:MAG: accessory factor UbiK family protein, partial [Chloroflexi bacterium]|nr:accessory factor UbiK family protein [Chloroflexota bacterium]
MVLGHVRPPPAGLERRQLRREVEALARQQVERLLERMDLVTRDEFEAVKEMAAKARAEQDDLAARLAALEAKAPVIAFSFSDPQPWLARAKAAGAITMCQVQTMEAAREAVAAGADILVAQGNEAGGHTGRLAMLPFLTRVLEEFPDVPVLAAGGIGSGRALAAALTAGADGVWSGTAFLSAPEA